MQIPQLLPKGFKVKALRAPINAIIQALRSIRIKGDDKFIRTKETPNGTVIELLSEEVVKAVSGSSVYKGMFKVVQKDDTTIQIYDSFEADDYNDATNAGECQINGTPFTIPKAELTVSADESRIFLLATLDGSGNVIQPTLEIDTTTAYEAGKFKGLISRQNFVSSKITTVTQEHRGFMFGWIYSEDIG